MSDLHYRPTKHDLWVEHLGDELGKLSVSDRLAALFCKSEVHELDEIAIYLSDYVRWERIPASKSAGKRDATLISMSDLNDDQIFVVLLHQHPIASTR
jgi:hypothetical protein